MIAIFNTKEDAQKFADKCHEYLSSNCPNYSAVKWQEPVKHPKDELYQVQVPQEFEKDYYPTTVKIAVAVDTEIKKASSTVEKVGDTWKTVEAEIIKK